MKGVFPMWEHAFFCIKQIKIKAMRQKTHRL